MHDESPSRSGVRHADFAAGDEREHEMEPAEIEMTLARLRAADGVFGCMPGFRLDFVHGRRIDLVELPPSPDAALVLGRHPECSFHVAADRSMASRHALLVPREDEPAHSRTSVAPALVLDFIELLPRSATRQILAKSSEHLLGVGRGLLRIHASGGAAFVVRHHRARAMLGCEFEIGPPTPAPSDARARISLHRGGIQIGRWLRDSELEAGLILAREPAGSHELDHPAAPHFNRLTRRLSRAHLLLRRELGGVVVYDLDSTPGTHERDHPIRRRAIEQATDLQLGPQAHTGVLLRIDPV